MGRGGISRRSSLLVWLRGPGRWQRAWGIVNDLERLGLYDVVWLYDLSGPRRKFVGFKIERFDHRVVGVVSKHLMPWDEVEFEGGW